MVLDFEDKEKEPAKLRQEKNLFSVFLALFGEDVSEKQQNRNKKTLPKNDCCFLA